MLCFALFMCVAVVSFSNPLVGDWKGDIRVSGVVLKIAAHFELDKKSKLSGSLDIISQSANGIVLDEITLDRESISFKMKGVGGNPTFTGVLNEGKLKGKYSQGPAIGSFELERGFLTKDLRPQTPKGPFDYIIQEVTFQGEKDLLSGTLTLPSQGMTHPVVVLVSGSGPQDRDETILNHKPFAVIADYLTRSGVAVFRYDDRGVGKSKGTFSKGDTFGFAKDAKGAVDYLLTRKDIEARNIGIIGHSEGATIANILSSKKGSQVSFSVMMAGIGVDGHRVLSYQRKQLHLNKNISLLVHDENEKIFTAALPLIQSSINENDFLKKLTPIVERYTKVLQDELGQAMDGEKYLSSIYKALSSPWMKTFLVLEPAKYLRNVKQPILVMNGTLDQQVDIGLNIPTIKESLKFAENDKVTYEMIEGVNHLFQTAPTGAVSEYSSIEETISPKVLLLIRDWVKKQVKR